MEIIWTKPALNDLSAIITYWDNRNSSRLFSQKIGREIDRSLSLLALFPKIGSLVRFERAEVKRVIILKQFSLIYKVEGDKIVVIAFISNHTNKI